MYDSEQHDPDLFVKADSAKSTGLYSEDFLPDDCIVTTWICEYDSYRVRGDD